VLTASLPPALERALASRPGDGGHASRSAELSRRYREPGRGPVARTDEDAAAYGVARLPATYAATRIALGELAARAAWLSPRTQLDLGAGPATAVWAAADVWPGLERAVAVEAQPAMTRLGRELADAAGQAPVARLEWLAGTLPAAIPDGAFDLVTLAYVLGELDEHARAETVERAWEHATALVVVEPGTPAGYRRVLAARDLLLGRGASLAAPCPHELACPWADSDEWCHFAVRLPRSAAHRRAKSAELGHEDEKLSYVAVVRGPADAAEARVLRHPQLRSGHVLLQLCGRDGIREQVVSRRERDRYRQARASDWGGAFE
jgi:ribosomal protein RSM22 (predicted rRNA methylase)